MKVNLRRTFYLWDPVDSHKKDQLKENSKVSHLSFTETILLPDPTSELENHQAVEDTIKAKKNEDDQMEIKKLWEVLTKHTRNPDAEKKLFETKD